MVCRQLLCLLWDYWICVLMWLHLKRAGLITKQSTESELHSEWWLSGKYLVDMYVKMWEHGWHLQSVQQDNFHMMWSLPVQWNLDMYHVEENRWHWKHFDKCNTKCSHQPSLVTFINKRYMCQCSSTKKTGVHLRGGDCWK
jgi:hypothetical protein